MSFTITRVIITDKSCYTAAPTGLQFIYVFSEILGSSPPATTTSKTIEEYQSVYRSNTLPWLDLYLNT
jgi:hypothetical protein